MPPHASINSARGYFDTSSAVVPTSAMRLPTTNNAAVLHEKFIPGNPRDKAAVRNKIHRFLRAAYKHRFTNCLINKPENALNESLFAEKDLNSVFRKYNLNSTRNRPCVLH